ncbi:MAG: cytidylate kinase family protein [Chloroflexi bacterium]|nr:cytidylate kinase family protein [Chloroflexota bacterium]MBI4506195.1 cytidylate kinase family protein [Chloroflexota bacterium]
MAIFTISRQLGSLGDTVAEELARRLNAPLMDPSLVMTAASGYGLGSEQGTPPEMAERAPTLLQRLGEDRQRYGVLIRSVLYDFVAEHSDAVIVGLGGQAVFAPVRHVYRFLIVAPFEVRVERVIGDRQVDRKTATVSVHQSDRERAGYYHYMHHVDWLNPELYNVVVNSEGEQVESVVDLLLGVAERLDRAPTSESRQVLEDLALAARVEARLVTSHQVRVFMLAAQAAEGHVRVDGVVDSLATRAQVEHIVRETPGVQDCTFNVRARTLLPPSAGLG